MELIHPKPYPRDRREFQTRPATFTVREAAPLVDHHGKNVDIRATENHPEGVEHVIRHRIEREIQTRPLKSHHLVGTDSVEYESGGVLHAEGGWSEGTNPNDAEQVFRIRRREERLNHYMEHISELEAVVTDAILENNAINIYEEYFEGQETELSNEPPYARTLTVLRDPLKANRSAACLSWFPGGAYKLAVAYANLNFRALAVDAALDSYVWDVDNPNVPELALHATSPLWAIEYNPKDPHVLAGGCYNGLVSFWDTRTGSDAVGSSSVEQSHRDPAYSVKWIQSKQATELFSVSTDGRVLWWDTRRLEEPTDSLELFAADDVARDMLLGGVVLDYEWSLPTRFMVGTEQGVILACNRKVKDTERITKSYRGHHGPIYALQRNPFFPKYFLTVGDWTARVWMEDISAAVITTQYHASYMTGARWSPTRPGVFLTAKMDGSVDVWDLLHKQNDPTLTLQVSDAAIDSLSLHSRGRLAAVGSRDGTTTLLELSSGLSVMQAGERNAMGAMFDREMKREKELEKREPRKHQGGPAPYDADDLDHVPEELLVEAERDFYAMVRAAEETQRHNMSAASEVNLAGGGGGGSVAGSGVGGSGMSAEASHPGSARSGGGRGGGGAQPASESSAASSSDSSDSNVDDVREY